MPIVDLDDENKTPAEAVVVNDEQRKLYTDEDFKTSILFNKDHELDTIVRYIEGNKWTIDYFLQIRDINDTALLPDPNVPATTLKYNRINNLVITLSGSIDQTDPNEVIGNGVINAGFLPNYGDPFIATLTGGREAIFTIMKVTKKRYNLHESYDVEFKLFAFLDKDSLLYRDIVTKTIRKYTYDNDYLMDKSSPIILNKDYADKLDLKKTRQEILNFYFKIMVDPRKNIIIPETNTGTYLDTLLTDFIFKTVMTNEVKNMDKISRMTFETDTVHTVFDVILNRSIKMLKTCDTDIGFIRVQSQGIHATNRTLAYLGVTYIVDRYVSDPDNIDIVMNHYDKPADLVEPIRTKDANYIFSNAFYNQDRVNCGPMETAVLDYLGGNLVEMSELKKLIDNYVYWDLIDQYYLLPILLILIKDHTTSTFSNI